MPVLFRISRPALLLGLAAVLAGVSGASGRDAAAAPDVVVSVKPVHSLAAAVMDGVDRPRLLVAGAQSPHTYSLKPSQALALARADLIVWVGPTLESFLAGPLHGLSDKRRELRLVDAPGVTVLPVRRAGAWAGHRHGPAEDGHAGEAGEPGADSAHEPSPAETALPEGARDPHVWLDPGNAGAIVRALAARLASMDPANARRYLANRDAALARIDALDRELRAMLAPVQGVPYMVFHDAYHYFERHYGLRPVGALTLSPERAPSARRLLALRRRLQESGARCVFHEPQFPPRLVATLIEDTGARSAELDPLGAGLQAGPAAWFTLMRGLAGGLRDCLAAP